MELNEYLSAAMATSGDTDDLTFSREDIILAYIGLTIGGEAGELQNYCKKVIFHHHPFDRMKLIDELGDLQWYIAKAAQLLGISLETVAVRNLEKLHARYPNGFSASDSINRKE